jgi:hypothetical protein
MQPSVFFRGAFWVYVVLFLILLACLCGSGYGRFGAGLWVTLLSQPWVGFGYWFWPRLFETPELANSAIDDDIFTNGEVVISVVGGVLNAGLLWGLSAICRCWKI